MTTTTSDRPVLADPAPAADPTSAGVAHPWLGLAVVLAAMIVDILDSTILNVGAASIKRDLGMSSSAVEWVAASYTLAMSVGLMTGGRLGDLLGRRRMLLAGIAGFLGTSIACALAWSGPSLIAFRVLQGLSAAVVTPQVFGLIRDLFPGPRMAKAFAVLGPVIGVSTILGPVVAGGLLDLDPFGTGWRSLFLINVPVAVGALVVGASVLPARPAEARQVRFDVLGTVMLAGVSLLLVFPLVDGRSLGWPLWIFGLLAATVPVLALFVGHQRRRVRDGKDPLVEVSVLRKRSYVSGVLFVMAFFAVVVGFPLTVGLFLQVGLGMTPMHASLVLSASAVGAFLGTAVGAWAATAVGRPILHIGLVIMAVGTGILLLALHGAAVGDVSTWDLAPGLGVFGLGSGMIFVPLFSIVTGDIDDHEVGSASALLESMQQLGASVGIAVLATLYFSSLSSGSPVRATERCLEVTLAFLATTFVAGWFLPRRARAHS
ncbi:putative MFS family arabinose efflux permease [Motilibacter rhizosphaerae]|uniref:Putative MFS family arabinose efflux permease n=1 Tax=Motilibacter rhizosphaerae TaxID=598652 RepID=A0A4Q7NBD6_9ACTN|nr:MFS transporter [Motilibacter rhizosphaerae]RZS80173.1 putative MFS family arabinose efflux permease [Motilibacter rhizosphaerae]